MNKSINKPTSVVTNFIIGINKANIFTIKLIFIPQWSVVGVVKNIVERVRRYVRKLTLCLQNLNIVYLDIYFSQQKNKIRLSL